MSRTEVVVKKNEMICYNINNKYYLIKNHKIKANLHFP